MNLLKFMYGNNMITCKNNKDKTCLVIVSNDNPHKNALHLEKSMTHWRITHWITREMLWSWINHHHFQFSGLNRLCGLWPGIDSISLPHLLTTDIREIIRCVKLPIIGNNCFYHVTHHTACMQHVHRCRSNPMERNPVLQEYRSPMNTQSVTQCWPATMGGNTHSQSHCRFDQDDSQ